VIQTPIVDMKNHGTYMLQCWRTIYHQLQGQGPSSSIDLSSHKFCQSCNHDSSKAPEVPRMPHPKSQYVRMKSVKQEMRDLVTGKSYEWRLTAEDERCV
jgi:hypothetical protein